MELKMAKFQTGNLWNLHVHGKDFWVLFLLLPSFSSLPEFFYSPFFSLCCRLTQRVLCTDMFLQCLWQTVHVWAHTHTHTHMHTRPLCFCFRSGSRRGTRLEVSRPGLSFIFTCCELGGGWVVTLLWVCLPTWKMWPLIRWFQIPFLLPLCSWFQLPPSTL